MNQSTPVERGQFDRFDGAPGSTTVDDLGLVETDDRLGQGVIRVAAAADRGLDSGLGETFGVTNRKVLTSRVLKKLTYWTISGSWQ